MLSDFNQPAWRHRLTAGSGGGSAESCWGEHRGKRDSPTEADLKGTAGLQSRETEAHDSPRSWDSTSTWHPTFFTGDHRGDSSHEPPEIMYEVSPVGTHAFSGR